MSHSGRENKTPFVCENGNVNPKFGYTQQNRPLTNTSARTRLLTPNKTLHGLFATVLGMDSECPRFLPQNSRLWCIRRSTPQKGPNNRKKAPRLLFREGFSTFSCGTHHSIAKRLEGTKSATFNLLRPTFVLIFQGVCVEQAKARK